MRSRLIGGSVVYVQRWRHQEINSAACAHTECQETAVSVRLEVLVESEGTAIPAGIGGSLLVPLSAGHDAGLLVVTNTLLEEVGLATEGDVLHEVEGVGGPVDLLVSEGDEQPVGDEFNVLLHEVRVHAEQGTGEGLSEELLLDLDGINNDVLDELLVGAVLEVGEQEAREVGVETFVTGDELIGEGKAGHEATLLEPENGGKGTAEEDTLDGSEGNETLSEGGLAVSNPAESPVGLLADAGN